MVTKKTSKRKSLTKLEQEKQDKFDFYEKAEQIFETGHDSRSRGAKAVKEIEKEKAKEDANLFDTQVFRAEKQRRFDDFNYLSAVREACVEGINQIDHRDYPGWRIKLYVTTGKLIAINKQPFATKRGLLAIVVSPKKEYYALGMEARFEPIIDVNGARALAVSIEDTLDYYCGYAADSPQKDKLWKPKTSSLQAFKPSSS